MANISEMEDSKILAEINGKEVECDVLFQYSSEDYEEVFIGYTDNTYDEKGALNIYTAKMNPFVPNKLIEITDPKEQELMKSVIDEIIKNNK